ncbi:MAG: PQQ-dependent sugar dehydrogenase, partial [Saprospiraceae bacterium]
MKNFCLLGIIIAVSFIHCKTKETAPVEEPSANAVSNFKQFCTPCHGDDGDVFVDRTFRHGDSKDSLISSIAMGHVDSDMVSFKNKMSETEIAALADYLGQAIVRRKTYDFTDSITSNVFHHQSMSVKLDTIASGLTSPWGMAFLPSGDYIYTDRNGSLYRQSKGKQTLIKGTPPSLVEQQGGLLDVATHPDFAKNQ